jgi:hypothetical protein
MEQDSLNNVGDGKAHFNIRCDSKLRSEIEKRAKVEDIPLAAWCRKAFHFALKYMDEEGVVIAPKAELKKLMLEVLEEEGLLKKE